MTYQQRCLYCGKSVIEEFDHKGDKTLRHADFNLDRQHRPPQQLWRSAEPMSQANIESLLVTSSEKVVGSFDRTITSDAPKRTDTVLDVPTVANRMQLVHECLLRWVETPMDKGGYNKRGVSAPAYPLQTPFIPYHRETLAKALEMTGGPIDRS